MPLDESDSFVVHAVHKILLPRQQFALARAVPGNGLRAKDIREKVRPVSHPLDLGHQFLIETMIGRPQFQRSLVILVSTEVPLPDHPRGIARRLEALRNGDVPPGERIGRGRTQVIEQPVAGRILAGEQTRPIGRTNRGRGIGLRHPDPVPRQLIKTRGLIEGAAVATQFRPSKVIRKNEHDVRWAPRSRNSKQERRQNTEYEKRR